MAQNTKATEYSEQNVLNRAFDRDLGLLLVMAWGYNGQTAQANAPDAMATKITTPLVSGSPGPITYIGIAAPGTAQSTAKWQCKKIDSSVTGTTTITWADSGNFSQTATDLTSLTYS